ncbi:hypothetical protein chiPu_0016745 [Chiloscyllium punctatum]|uniref:Uncharacterized protein n=1 Tax=Chiloscyllium punctatum TaxID=137246 RepID=A0A401T6D1_CHIPU|nr:hypothetical protein [Chiloscyllium punctatum]
MYLEEVAGSVLLILIILVALGCYGTLPNPGDQQLHDPAHSEGAVTSNHSVRHGTAVNAHARPSPSPHHKEDDVTQCGRKLQESSQPNVSSKSNNHSSGPRYYRPLRVERRGHFVFACGETVTKHRSRI